MERHILGLTQLSERGTFHNSKEDSVRRLSDEIMVHIFSYLPKSALKNCSLTCRRFYKLSMHRSLWKRLDLGGKAISAELLHKLIDRGVQYLRLARATISGKFFPNPPPHTPSRLHFLDLSMVDNDDPIVICEILTRCKDLIAVSLESCSLNDLCCFALAKNRNLKVLNLSSARGLDSTGVQAIMAGCRNLEELNVAWTQLDNESVTILCSTAPSTLMRLNLAGCHGEALLDHHIATVCARCPALVELDVSDAQDLTGVTMEIISKSSNLWIFSCSRCYKIDPSALARLPPSLVELNIFNNIHAASWEQFITFMPQSVKLNARVFSTIARPTVGIRRTSIWGHRVRDL